MVAHSSVIASGTTAVSCVRASVAFGTDKRASWVRTALSTSRQEKLRILNAHWNGDKVGMVREDNLFRLVKKKNIQHSSLGLHFVMPRSLLFD